MLMISIAAFFLLAWLIEKLDDRRVKRSTERVEQIHKNYYDYIDRCFDGLDAQMKKEQADILIHDYWENHLHIDYKPEHLKEVTTAASRNRIKRTNAAVEKAVTGMEYRPLTEDERDQMLADRCMHGDIEEFRRIRREAQERWCKS